MHAGIGDDDIGTQARDLCATYPLDLPRISSFSFPSGRIEHVHSAQIQNLSISRISARRSFPLSIPRPSLCLCSCTARVSVNRWTLCPSRRCRAMTDAGPKSFVGDEGRCRG